jgi:hypothetical protein
MPVIGEAKMPPLGHHYPTEVSRVLKEAVQEASDELAALNQLSHYQGGQIPLDYSSDHRIDEMLSYLAFSRQLARWKCAEMLHNAEQGDTQFITDNTDIMLGIADLLKKEPLIISSLTRIAIQALTYEKIIRICNLHELKPAQLAALQKMIADSYDQRGMYWSFLGERTFLIQAGRQTLHGEYQNACGKDQGCWSSRIPGYRGIVYKDIAFGIRYMNRLLKYAKNSIEFSHDEEQRIEKQRDEAPDYYFFSSTLLPSLEGTLILANRQLAYARVTYTALAAERFRIEQGHWPESPAELVPKYLDAVPSDPFEAEATIRYKQFEDGIVVYSVGENTTDEGGAVYETDSRVKKSNAKDWGVILLNPALRGRPAVEAETQPTTHTY